MLNPSSPTQKNLSEEDTSGSDAGSEVSLEQTDRFGFIRTNGSTAGNLGPPPELVRQREIKWINIIQQWDRILLKKTSKVKAQCQKGIPASLRAKCWPLLCGATDRMKQNKHLYQSLDSKPALQSWVDVIERDLDRQFPFHEMFLSKDGHGQRGLFRVLKAYTQHQPEEGYCQAQGPVAAVLLMNMPAEEAFWCLVQISEQYLPGYYSPLLEGVLFDAAMLSWVLKRTCPAAHKHLQHHGVEPLMFATDWLMCLFTRHLPFNTLLRVWDLFFCYGVRVLLQVAVVLVRRVLGRAEQRKECQGQMETLEKLRGVREQIQEDADTFIAEVCSVPLSVKDLEKQTVKESEKWRKDKPLSTFDPKGRCHGFHKAWARARQNKEERARKERETGNLSVPIARSSSTLSLSPSLLRKRWRRGGKPNTSEWDGDGKVMRHLSMGAKEDYNSWTELNFEEVQDVQEEDDVVPDEHKQKRETNTTGQTDVKDHSEEHLNMDQIQNIPIVHIEETEIVNEQIEKEETGIAEKGESKPFPKHTEETNVETQLSQGPANVQPVENALSQLREQYQQEEELGSCSQLQAEEQQTHEGKGQDIEINNTNEETGNQVEEESEHMTSVQKNLSEIQKDASADPNKETPDFNLQICAHSTEKQVIQSETEPHEGTGTDNVQQIQVDTEFSGTRTNTSPDTEGTFKEIPTKDPDLTTETQQQQEEVITETDTSSSGVVLEAKCCGPELLQKTEIEKDHTQTEAETALSQPQEKVTEQHELETEIVQTDSELDTRTEADPVIPSSAECTQQDECSDIVNDTETEAATHETESRAAFPQCSEVCDRGTCEVTQEENKRILTVHLEEQVDSGHTAAEKTSSETQTTVVATVFITPSQKEEAESLTTSSERRRSLVEMRTEEPSPEQPASQVTVGNIESLEENAIEEDNIFIPTCNVAHDPHSELIPQVKDRNSSESEINNSGLTQISGRRSSRSSGDFCVRRSSSSHGSRLARKLSEDLFTSPQKDSQSQSSPIHPDVQQVESQSNPGAVNQTFPEVTHSSEVKLPPPTLSMKEDKVEQQEPQAPPKRFGLFRRLRGEQPKKTKKKETQQIQVPKILIQDFSDGTGKLVEEEEGEKLSSRERRRRRREQDRREKDEERLRKKKEKEFEKERERERRKPQTRGKSFQLQQVKDNNDLTGTENTGSKTFRRSTPYAESYF